MTPSHDRLQESRQAELLRTTSAITALAVFFVILRFISRVKKGVMIGADDYTLLAALVQHNSLRNTVIVVSQLQCTV